jgi:beta-lactamase regulating signal transducer with metallopeptidase domain
VRWIAKRIDLEHEIACDNLVIAAAGTPRSYAACLTRIVELSDGAAASLPVATTAGGRSHLAVRVNTLLDRTRHRGTRLLKKRFAAMAAALASVVWLAAKTPELVAFSAPPEFSLKTASIIERILPAAPAQA